MYIRKISNNKTKYSAVKKINPKKWQKYVEGKPAERGWEGILLDPNKIHNQK